MRLQALEQQAELRDGKAIFFFIGSFSICKPKSSLRYILFGVIFSFEWSAAGWTEPT